MQYYEYIKYARINVYSQRFCEFLPSSFIPVNTKLKLISNVVMVPISDIATILMKRTKIVFYLYYLVMYCICKTRKNSNNTICY